MFGRKRDAPAKKSAPKTPEPAGEIPPGAEQSLDFLAEFLRTFGEHAFDLDEVPAAHTCEHCEGWARHLLVGVPAPGREAPAAGADPGAPVRRDFPGLRRYFAGHRSEEERFVVRSLSDLREAIWAFVQGMRRSISADQLADGEVSHRMRRLESAVRTGSSEDIKREALEAVGVVTGLVSERGERQRAQVADLGARLEEMQSQLTSAREQATEDPLTKVFNRAALDEHVERVLDFSSLFGQRAHLIMIDVDHFKWINDNHGHPVGDVALQQVADSLSRSFLRKDDFVARYGGEEFAIVLRGGDLAAAESLAERALSALRDLEIAAGDEALRITASAGVAQLRLGEGASDWVERADRALYEAKQAGRDRVVVDPEEAHEAR